MKRKLESDEELDENINSGDVDELRDQLLEQELSNKGKFDNTKTGDEFVRVVKLSGNHPNIALPKDWIAMYHKSGGIIYLNRTTRVCTWARPYHIGQASVRKHDVPTVAIPCLYQIMALNNNKKRRKQKKPKLLDIHDGVIGHHTGNLANQSGDRDIRLGNHGNQPEPITDDQYSDMGCHDDSNGVSDGNHGNIDSECGDVEGCYGNNDGSQSDKSGDIDDNNEMNDGYLCAGNVDDLDGTNDGGTDGNLRNMDGSQSTSDGIQDGTIDGNPDSVNSDNNDITTSTAQDGTNSEMDTDDNDSTSKTKTTYSTSMLQTSGQINMVDHQNHTINKASVKAPEKRDSDSDSGNVSENAELPQLQMSSVQDITNYLGKLWDFCEITKEQESKLLLTDTNEIHQGVTQEYPSTKILKTIPYLVEGTNRKSKNNEKVFINPAGKSARSLLHEYCLKMIKSKPEYTTRESGVPKTPFLAIVHVDGKEHGRGMAASKKQAKHVAAQRTLEILIPKSFERLTGVEENLKIFDKIPIEDPNVYELTSKLGLLSPYQVLKECIKRNQGVLTSEVKFELKHGADKQLYYTMEFGKHKATGTCRNKKMGREFGSQVMLQKLYPHLKSWGSVLRIYVDEHTTQEFAKPEAPARVTTPNVNKELLSDLKQEMWKVMKKKTKVSRGFIANIDI